MSELHTKKQQLRMQLKEIIKQISPDERKRFSGMITRKIINLPEYINAKAIMVFLSMETEYDTSELINNAIQSGKIVCAPKVDWKHWSMHPVKIANTEDIIIDNHNLKEPKGDEVISPNELDFILVPGLAFDIKGHRLGRGGGFYDKFLSRADVKRAFRLAPTFDCQIIPSIPTASKDICVDMIITPHKILRIVRATR